MTCPYYYRGVAAKYAFYIPGIAPLLKASG